MKTTLFTAGVALLSAAVASAASELKYSEAFNAYTANTSTNTPSGQVGDLALNLGTGALTLSNLGLDSTTGFSVAFDMYYDSTKMANGQAWWKDAFTMALGGTTYKVETNSSGKLVLYKSGNSDPLGIDGLVLTSSSVNQSWTHVGFTFERDSMKVYVDGSLALTEALDTSSYAIGSMGRGGNVPASEQILLDNVAVYSGVLAENDFAYLASTPTAGGVLPVAPVPEPTTATLSLLALAGLAARRRRR